MHSTNFNTVWSGNTLDYDTKTLQSKIIEGEGSLEIISQKNASRKYIVSSSQEVRVIDYTFYFSGWAVYIDGEKTIMQWQDPNYRGIITYKVPAGTHEVYVVYENTDVRTFGMIATITAIILAFYFIYVISTDLKISKFGK